MGILCRNHYQNLWKNHLKSLWNCTLLCEHIILVEYNFYWYLWYMYIFKNIWHVHRCLNKHISRCPTFLCVALSSVYNHILFIFVSCFSVYALTTHNVCHTYLPSYPLRARWHIRLIPDPSIDSCPQLSFLLLSRFFSFSLDHPLLSFSMSL